MPIRDKFPADYFDRNPLAGESPQSAFKRLQWGNEHRNQWRIEAPEPMAVLGRLAKLVFVGGKSQQFRDWQMFVAVGTKSNKVYLVPMVKRRPLDFPVNFNRGCEAVAKLRRIDYYSEKGNDNGYYYHDHEPPYPLLCSNEGHFIIEPAPHRGGRSYAVNDEGIIG
jgi:hypothetical protein